ncbi:hypothetical protein SAMN04487859_10741 [Roseovarius lutimaris]|uniref:VOC domain-containing protein n=1 Tax=Roseovarius lutimaris TaxID=1005928 RepID=A0A1I5B3N0_9RHOB|nr:VOC family protein [Roseovarius lutimaris]SFN69221.1 hypothetical protein SAMN04487859_10741 [Roseovarius lutimaris]
MTERGFEVRGLGEIAIRCRNFDAMCRFYSDVIGLVPLEGAHRDGIRFFRLGNGVEGHTAVLALFEVTGPVATGLQSSLHHLALSLPRRQQAAVERWYEARGLEWHVEEFGWIGWRGVFTKDPEGNTVELVSYDPTLGGQGV